MHPSIRFMSIEVFVSERPAVRRHTWAASVLTLGVSVTLAAVMVWQRSGDLLAPRIEPHGWSVSFRPPRRARDPEFGTTILGPAYRFRGWSAAGRGVLLVVQRLEGWSVEDPLAACDLILRAYAAPVLAAGLPTRAVSFEKKLGPLEAVEVDDPALGVVVRAAMLDNGEAYAVSLAVDGPARDERWYGLFESTCESVRRQGR